MSKKLVLRAAAIAAATALVLVGATNSASAHVTVSSPDAKPGGYAKLVFRVPTESDTASTTKLVVSLPKDRPFAHVGAQVKDGWKVVKTTEKLAQAVKVGDVTLSEAITTVTWTATTAVGVPAERLRRVRAVGRQASRGSRLAQLPGYPDLQRRRGGQVGPGRQGRQRQAGAPGASAEASHGHHAGRGH